MPRNVIRMRTCACMMTKLLWNMGKRRPSPRLYRSNKFHDKEDTIYQKIGGDTRGGSASEPEQINNNFANNSKKSSKLSGSSAGSASKDKSSSTKKKSSTKKQHSPVAEEEDRGKARQIRNQDLSPAKKHDIQKSKDRRLTENLKSKG